MIQKNILTPFQKFVKIESLSGMLLMGATVLALIWANSSFADSYGAFWNYKFGITTSNFELVKPLILWINDGLMAVFFFLIGLEIKREVTIGELNTPKKLAFPLVGALGGMLVPVLFYLILNNQTETMNGWGIPMATDIAFSLAILRLLGNRVPLSLKIFLTAFAIVDDIGAVLIIALFYSGSIQASMLIIAFAILIILYFLSYKGFYSKFITIAGAIVVWYLFLKSGVHPTIAGILMAFAIPVRQKIDTGTFLDNLSEITDNIKKARVSEKPILTKEQIEQIDDLEDWTSHYQSPLQHLEHKLHDWVAFLVVPVFALANAGVSLTISEDVNLSLVSLIVLCLIVGNSIGVSTLVLLSKKLRIIELPKDLNTQHIIGVSFLAGIGFTMAIFVATLAFKDQPALIDSAKLGILIGSLISALLGYTILRFTKNKNSINTSQTI